MKSNTTRRAVLGAAVPAIAAGTMPAMAHAVPVADTRLAALVARHAKLFENENLRPGITEDEELMYEGDDIAGDIAAWRSANHAELTLKARFALTVLPTNEGGADGLQLSSEMEFQLIKGILHDVLRLDGEVAR